MPIDKKRKKAVNSAQKWYQSRTVQAAIITGIFAVIAALIALSPDKHEMTDVKGILLTNARIDSLNLALIAEYTALAKAYLELSKDQRLTEEERNRYKKLYEETKAELEKQKRIAEAAIERRVQAETALRQLKEKFGLVGIDTLLFRNEMNEDSLLKEQTIETITRDAISVLFSDWEPPRAVIGMPPLSQLAIEEALQHIEAVDEIYAKVDSMLISEDYQLENRFKVDTLEAAIVVRDFATGLMWQQDGSYDLLDFKEARKYVQMLDDASYAGFHDWRLPNLDEIFSLLEQEKKNGYLHIEPIFSSAQWHIWTDYRVLDLPIVVEFFSQKSYPFMPSQFCIEKLKYSYVRAVRGKFVPQRNLKPKRLLPQRFSVNKKLLRRHRPAK